MFTGVHATQKVHERDIAPALQPYADALAAAAKARDEAESEAQRVEAFDGVLAAAGKIRELEQHHEAKTHAAARVAHGRRRYFDCIMNTCLAACAKSGMCVCVYTIFPRNLIERAMLANLLRVRFFLCF